ncbi:hypothetical protein EV426DRAFT_530095 [Tirmania nivea]|nr:hypothetical protein EV426DRAFT_530095 [Tirmania nivea]
MEPPVSRHTYCISSIQVHIYGLDQLRPLLAAGTPPPLAVLHTLHPRLETHAYMSPIIRQCLADHYSAAPPPRAGLLAISFDQRNHGTREVSSAANLAFTSPPPPHPHAHEPNPTHAMDMLGVYAGTTLDLGLIMDLLPSYLEFHYNPPAAARGQIALGVSLGGHAAYLAALHLPKITSAVVVIGCPDYPALMRHRLRQCKLVPRDAAAASSTRYLPESFRDLISTPHPPPVASSPLLTSPHVTPLDTLAGKKLLVLSGREDKVVPAELARGFVERVRRAVEEVGGVLFGTGAGIREVVFEGVGHEFTEGMAREVREFVRERVQEAGAGK